MIPIIIAPVTKSGNTGSGIRDGPLNIGSRIIGSIFPDIDLGRPYFDHPRDRQVYVGFLRLPLVCLGKAFADFYA